MEALPMNPPILQTHNLAQPSELLRLPVSQNAGAGGVTGGESSIRIQAPTIEAVLEVAGLPRAGHDTSADAADEGLLVGTGGTGVRPETVEERGIRRLRDEVEMLDQMARRLFELGAKTEPETVFALPAGPGQLYWGALHLRNRDEIVAGLIRLARYGPADGRAATAASFPALDGGRGASGEAPGAAQSDGQAPT